MYVSPLFSCSQNQHIVVVGLVWYSHWFAVFQTEVASFTNPPPSPYYSLPFAFMSFSLSAVNSSLFLGLVVWRSSTHVQLDL